LGVITRARNEQTYKLILLPKTVPVLVNERPTKAAFDLEDPRIDRVGELKRKEPRERSATRPACGETWGQFDGVALAAQPRLEYRAVAARAS
jgi:hypothetical protein